MSRSIHVVALICAVLLLASDARAQIILSPATAPGGGPLAHPMFRFTYFAPPGAVVVIDMSGCAGLVPVPTPGVAVACGPPGPAGNTLTAVAGAAGAAFSVLGYGLPGPPAAFGLCATVSVDGVPAGPINVAAVDMDGSGGCGPADGSVFIADYFSGTNPSRSNLNGIGGVNPADISLFILARDLVPADVTPAGGCP